MNAHVESDADRNTKDFPELELETTNCNMCGCADGQIVYKGYDTEFKTCSNKFAFVACSECGHLYLKDRPKFEDLDVIYTNYLTTNTESAYHPSTTVAWIKDNLFDKRRLRHVLNEIRDDSNVLDIGAGIGRLLKLIGRIGPNKCNLYASELEYDAKTQESLHACGITPVEGPIEEWETDLKFSAITGIHVIEHVYDPQMVFRWVSEHLEPGGVLYLETPDAGALCAKIFGDHWGMTHFPRHTNLFSKETLRQAAERNGLIVLKHGGTTTAPAWNMSIRNRLKLDALGSRRSLFDIFNYQNIGTLSFFTCVDVLFLTLRIPTSTQYLVARKV